MELWMSQTLKWNTEIWSENLVKVPDAVTYQTRILVEHRTLHGVSLLIDTI